MQKEDQEQPASSQPREEQPGSTEAQTEDKGAASTATDEQQETAEQRESRLLLQQIPDDPGGLLRRKFLYQYRQRGQQTETGRTW
jgi:Ca-activated chloride channel family protein